VSAGCVEQDRFKDDYEDQVDRTNEVIRELNALRSGTFESDKLHRKVGFLLEELDTHAQACRAAVRHIRDNMETLSESEIRTQMADLKAKIDEALSTISEIEETASKKVIEAIETNAVTTVQEDSQPLVQAIHELQQDALSRLAGMRDLFLGMRNDLVDDANARLAEVSGDSLPERVAETRSSERPRDPRVSSRALGGRITGTVQDSVTGRALAGARVGFKLEAESTDYFATTQTDAAGQYESPYLLPGEYHVDIRHPDYVSSRAERVAVTIGRDVQENVSVTQPIGDAEYRVTIRWCNPTSQGRGCEGAVRDVDSYLQVPGLGRPINYQTKQGGGSDLDRDETQWSGPETTTIRELKQGTYIYYVNNFNARTNLEALGNSEVRVFVYKGQSNEVFRTYSVPAGTGLTYELFRIENGVYRETGRYNGSLPTS